MESEDIVIGVINRRNGKPFQKKFERKRLEAENNVVGVINRRNGFGTTVGVEKLRNLLSQLPLNPINYLLFPD